MTETKYLLRLGNSYSWSIIAMPETRSWVEKFAAIMNLEREEQDRHRKWPRIFISLRQSGKDGHVGPINVIDLKTEEDFPRSGWEAQDLSSLRLWFHRDVPDIICEIGNEGNHELNITRMWTSLFILGALRDFHYLQVQDSGGLPLHAAVVERDGKSVLLVGPGGSGKSTLCRRLPPPWRALSDDQSLIARDGQKKYLAHPVPTWSDYSYQRSELRWDAELYLPLAAIFFIEQARSDKVVPIGQAQAAVFINRSSTEVNRNILWGLSNEAKRKLKTKTFDNSCQLAKAIPAYILRVSLNGRAWDKMEKVFNER